ncbi:T9SS type A sorting domain-containing protein [bacterium]|nr:T9SS type A sorting domain-containing protein [bacterium]
MSGPRIHVFVIAVLFAVLTGTASLYGEAIPLDSAGSSSEAFMYPTLDVDREQIIVYVQHASDSGDDLRGYRLSSGPELTVLESRTYLTERSKAKVPRLVRVGTKWLLLWYEDIADLLPSPTSRDHVQVFCLSDHPFPSDSQLASCDTLRSLKPGWMDKKSETLEEPQVVLADTTIYLAYHTMTGMDNQEIWRTESVMRSISYTSGHANDFSFYQQMGGLTSLVPRGDSVYWVHGRQWCDQEPAIYCANIVSSERAWLVRDTGRIGITGFSSHRVWSPTPTNMAVDYDDSVAWITNELARDVGRLDLRTGMYDDVVHLPGALPYELGLTLFPLTTLTYNIVFEPDHRLAYVYDQQWQFVQTAQIPVTGSLLHFSEFRNIPGTDRVVFAYASEVEAPVGTALVYVDQISFDIVTDVIDSPPARPVSMELAQNYPNPFNPTTSIRYALSVAADARLTVSNVLGQHVRTVVDCRQGAGSYEVEWDGRDDRGRVVGSGVYFYRLEVGDRSLSRKMLLLK